MNSLFRKGEVMAYQSPINNQVYGLNVPLGQASPAPIVAQRHPTVNDQGLPGQTWIDEATQEFFINCGILNGDNIWVYNNQGSSTFSTVEITGSGTVLTVDTGNSSLGGNLLVSGTATFDNAFSVVSGNNGVSINSGTGSLGISTDASATTVSIASGSAVKTLTVGSSNGASASTFQSGSGGLSITSNGGNLGLNSGVGTLGISIDVHATALSIGTGAAAKTIVAGNTTSGTTIALNTPSGTNVVINQGIALGTSSGPTITAGSGAPSFSAAQGSLYLRTDGSSSSTRAYINSNGSTGWIAVTTAS